jgi:hypothetical protein
MARALPVPEAVHEASRAGTRRDRLASIGDHHLFSRPGEPYQLRKPVFGFENVDLHSGRFGLFIAIKG